MKTVEKGGFIVFKCDECGREAGVSRDEAIALKLARQTAERRDWKWYHPHWGLQCPR